MQTVAVFALKGGVGKSALTVFLADFLSSLQEKRVLVIDLDPQHSASVALLGEAGWLATVQQGKSVGQMLLDYMKGNRHAFNVLSYVSIRPGVQGKKGVRYLQNVSLLASDREAWHELDAQFGATRSAPQPRHMESLRTLLQAVDAEFDICLIDFPASQTGPITQCGLAAADWWLLWSPIEWACATLTDREAF